MVSAVTPDRRRAAPGRRARRPRPGRHLRVRDHRARWSRSARSSTSSRCWCSPASTGLGGGFLRDVLIGAVPPAALADWRYLLVPVVAGLVTFFFHPPLGRTERVINVLDAAGLSLFCVTGALKALELRARSGAGRAAGDAHRHRRRDAARRADRPGAAGVPRRALRDPGAGRRAGRGARPPRPGCGRRWWRCRRRLVCFAWRVLAMRRGWNAPRAAASAEHLSAHQNIVPGSPLNGPTTFEVTQPP